MTDPDGGQLPPVGAAAAERPWLDRSRTPTIPLSEVPLPHVIVLTVRRAT